MTQQMEGWGQWMLHALCTYGAAAYARPLRNKSACCSTPVFGPQQHASWDQQPLSTSADCNARTAGMSMQRTQSYSRTRRKWDTDSCASSTASWTDLQGRGREAGFHTSHACLAQGARLWHTVRRWSFIVLTTMMSIALGINCCRCENLHGSRPGHVHV